MPSNARCGHAVNRVSARTAHGSQELRDVPDCSLVCNRLSSLYANN
jgi:hypothetical protein